MDSIKVFCPGSVANVSCGFDVLGIALDEPGDIMTVEKIKEPKVVIEHLDAFNLPTEPEMNVAGKAALAILEDLNPGFGFKITIDKKIHPGSGIGSSSASASGVVFAINQLMDQSIDEAQQMEYAMIGEYVASGSYHADNVAPALIGGIILIRGYKPLDYIKLPTPKELWMTVITPKIQIRTYDARRVLKRRVELKDAISQCGNLAGLIAGIYTEDYDLIGRSLKDVLIEPQRAALIQGFDELKASAIAHGALGSGISGSGPSVFAMSRGEDPARNVAAGFDKYYSLNGHPEKVSFRKAVIQSLAPDRGLYFPEEIPQLDAALLSNFRKMDKADVCTEAIAGFVGGDIPKEELKRIVSETINFPTPVVKVNDRIHTLELFHGPTLAFKDVGARFMARCLQYFLKDENRKTTILVATSGDTGGAVANGFLGVEGISVVILYPKGKVSPLQEKQLTALGQNIKALEVDGNFDDCQDLVKAAFIDPEINEKLGLTSANSINVARWLPQMFYYINALQQVPEDASVTFCVPSGNFGNICAGIMAQQLGFPIHHFVAATNVNDVVTRYLSGEEYQPKPTIPTLSNAMDVSSPSNFVRIEKIFGGREAMKKILSAYRFDDAQTQAQMKKTYAEDGYLLDPHGAVGLGYFLVSKKAPDSILLGGDKKEDSASIAVDGMSGVVGGLAGTQVLDKDDDDDDSENEGGSPLLNSFSDEDLENESDKPKDSTQNNNNTAGLAVAGAAAGVAAQNSPNQKEAKNTQSTKADSDGDGVPDSEDNCADVAGILENKGCPEVNLSADEKEAFNKAVGSVEFETASAQIKNSSLSKLDQVVSILKKHPEIKLSVFGHTDNTGDENKNLELSKARAESCINYIKTKGIAGDRLSAKGFGSSRPTADNSSEEGRKENRRVEFNLY
ncbi:unnamed protein product [Cyprideis torosa]|uniref:Threonine synthase-like 2 n=1 Tax=Cyprideis torosa TaxID=163714 RepID=A0A7R8ZUA5_9CRUS|nr:unnamed protein product [Cyprideis torosa]CAG0900146.1 unnamed protein product [Cyprideis torosa]